MGNKVRGFSLMELMVTMVLLGILVAFAIPAISGSSGNNAKIDGFANDLRGALQFSRLEAIRLGKNVTIAPHDGATWTSGWFVTHQNMNAVTNNLEKKILREYRPDVGYPGMTNPPLQNPVRAPGITEKLALTFNGRGEITDIDAARFAIQCVENATPTDAFIVQVLISGQVAVDDLRRNGGCQ